MTLINSNPLQDAARCRSESDWLIGINGTRAVTIKRSRGRSRQVSTVGRVQTPTLSFVIKKENEIRNFIPRTFHKISASFELSEGGYTGVYQKPDFKKTDEDKHDRIDRLWDKEEAPKDIRTSQEFRSGRASPRRRNARHKVRGVYTISRPFRKKPTGFIIFQQAEPSSSLRLSTKGTRQSLTRLAPIPKLSPKTMVPPAEKFSESSQANSRLMPSLSFSQTGWTKITSAYSTTSKSATTSPLFQRILLRADSMQTSSKSTTLFSSGSYQLFILRLNGMSPYVRAH